MGAMIASYVTLIAREVDRLADFYAVALGLSEIAASRSDRYREVDAGSIRIGIVSDDAYDLLDLPGERAPAGLRAVMTFAVADTDAIDRHVERAVAGGATLVKPRHPSSFGTMQAVLRDPAGNAFRFSASARP